MARMRAVAVAFASSAAFALVLASSLAAADGSDADGDGIPDDLEQATQRTVAATSSGDAFNVSSRIERGDLEDQLELSYKAGAFTVWYEQHQRVSSAYELELRNLVEWTDANGNGTIDDGEVVGSTPLGSAAFADAPVVRSNATNADGGRIFNFVVHSRTDEVTLNVTIAQRFLRLGDIVLTPMEANLNITIRHTLVHPAAKIGIELAMGTQGHVQYPPHSWDEANGFARNEASVNVTGERSDRSASVFFSWTTNAVADGAPTQVTLASRQASPDSYNLYLAYGAVPMQSIATIEQRTALGVEGGVYQQILRAGPELHGDVWLYAGSLIGVSAVVALTIVLANRRRKRRGE